MESFLCPTTFGYNLRFLCPLLSREVERAKSAPRSFFLTVQCPLLILIDKQNLVALKHLFIQLFFQVQKNRDKLHQVGVCYAAPNLKVQFCNLIIKVEPFILYMQLSKSEITRQKPFYLAFKFILCYYFSISLTNFYFV